jgi:hypothetical protein
MEDSYLDVQEISTGLPHRSVGACGFQPMAIRSFPEGQYLPSKTQPQIWLMDCPTPYDQGMKLRRYYLRNNPGVSESFISEKLNFE